MAYKPLLLKSVATTCGCLFFAMSPCAHAAPYVDWASDYTGSESGTLALWKFDDPNPGADSSGNGSTLSINATGTVTGVAGKFGEAFGSLPPRSESNNSYAFATDSAALFNTSELSVEFWFKPAFAVEELGAWNTLFDKSSSTGGIWLRIDRSGALTLLVGNGSTQTFVTTDEIKWDADVWYNIAVTFKNLSGEVNGDAEIKIFLDGEMKGERLLTGFGDMAATSQSWKIAQRRSAGYGSAPGYYDNFRIASVAYDYAPIPEPTSLGLLLLGGGVAAWRFRRNTSQ